MDMNNNKARIKELLREAINGKYQLVDEASFNKLLDTHWKNGFIIITSYRDDLEDGVNKTNFNKLKASIRQAGYSFIPVYGGFIENLGTPEETTVREPALIVPNFKAGTGEVADSEQVKALGLELAKAYNQDSYLYKPQGAESKAYYIDRNGNVDMEFSSKSINDMTQTYFTQLSKSQAGADRRFTFKEMYMNLPPLGTQGARKRHGELFYRLK